MTGFDTAVITANLRIVLMIFALTFVDWLLGVVLSIRAGTFDLHELPNTVKVWASEIFGLAIAAVATGLQLKFGEVDASIVVTAAFVALAASYSLRLLNNLREKIAALMGPQANAKAYFAKPERDAPR